jgi:hypothetical protein
VFGLALSGLAATLSGSWDTDVTINPTQTSFDLAIGLDSTVTVSYTVGDWTFTSVTDLTENGWADQDFAVAGVLGAFSISSGIAFTPSTAGFEEWFTSASVAIAGVSFGVDFYLADHDVELVLSGSGVAGDVTVDVEVTFGGIARTWAGYWKPVVGGNNDVCDLDWSGVTIEVGFPFCCADISLTVDFDCTGFVSAVFETTGIAIPNIPWLTLAAELTFTMTDKQILLSPSFNFGAIVCFDIYWGVDAWDYGSTPVTAPAVANPFTLGDITINGIGLSCDIGAVTFTGLSWWATGDMNDGGTYNNYDKPGLLYGTDYWEVYNIATNDDACCGPFAFDVSFFFQAGGSRLFDVAYVEANMSLQVASQFEFSMGLSVDVENENFSEWLIGFLVTW